MTPIDRVAQRAQAFTVLGVAATASRNDIRQAYRKLAFDTHPDHSPETTAEFVRITEAYRFVTDNADELGIKDDIVNEPQPAAKSEPARPQQSVSPRKVSRPQVQASETNFEQEELDECQALLDDEGGPGTLHLSTAVYRVGRSLTYFVPTALAKGRNEVAVPTGMLMDSRRVMPRIIAFDASEASGGYFEMDSETCAEHFPGARAIQIRFATA